MKIKKTQKERQSPQKDYNDNHKKVACLSSFPPSSARFSFSLYFLKDIV